MNNTVDEKLNRPEKCYTDFIEETFIKPIRTVTLVDDEYPTMDAFISGEELSDKSCPKFPGRIPNRKFWFVNIFSQKDFDFEKMTKDARTV